MADISNEFEEPVETVETAEQAEPQVVAAPEVVEEDNWAGSRHTTKRKKCEGLFVMLSPDNFTLDDSYSDLYLFSKGLWLRYKGSEDEDGRPLVDGRVPDWYKNALKV